MKLQFSLATLLVCMTVLAVICRLRCRCAVILKTNRGAIDGYCLFDSGCEPEIIRLPNEAISVAFACGGRNLLYVAWPLAALWTIRRLKSRRHTEPPVG